MSLANSYMGLNILINLVKSHISYGRLGPQWKSTWVATAYSFKCKHKSLYYQIMIKLFEKAHEYFQEESNNILKSTENLNS